MVRTATVSACPDATSCEWSFHLFHFSVPDSQVTFSPALCLSEAEREWILQTDTWTWVASLLITWLLQPPNCEGHPWKTGQVNPLSLGRDGEYLPTQCLAHCCSPSLTVFFSFCISYCIRPVHASPGLFLPDITESQTLFGDLLGRWFSKCAVRTSSFSIIWDLVRNANSYPRTHARLGF